MSGPQVENPQSLSKGASLFAVVVLYKLDALESPTLRSLLEAVQTLPDAVKLSILVWDNTPGGRRVTLPDGVRYRAAPHNPGLAQAYNTAWKMASAEGFEWLLTLDQDTEVPAGFLERVAGLTQTVGEQVAAIVPLVTDGDRTISPYRLAGGGVPRWYGHGFIGLGRGATYAVNSAATLRITALRDVGGYDPLFPLDLSDINLFHALYRAGKQVFIASDVRVHHELALLDKHKRMSMERYHAGLLDECAFYDMKLGSVARLERMVRMAGRVCKDLLKPELAGFRDETLRELKRRLLTRRRKRLAEWRVWAERRLAGAEVAPVERAGELEQGVAG